MLARLAELRAEHGRLLDAELARLTEELRKRGARLVVLFGSLARGRRDLFTDIDLLVVLESREDFPRRLARLYAELAPRVDADILAYTPAEFERMKDEPFLRRVLAEGVVLHAEEPA